MTLAQINASDGALRSRMADAFKVEDARLLLDALEQDILDGLDHTVAPMHGETPEAAVARWHSHLAGMRNVIRTIRNIGRDRAKSVVRSEVPLEHAIPLHLQEWAKQQREEQEKQQPVFPPQFPTTMSTKPTRKKK